MKFASMGRALALALPLCVTSALAAAASDTPAPPDTASSPATQQQAGGTRIGDSFDGWEVTLSPYTYHLHYDKNHTWVFLGGLERHYESNWLWGGAAFRNSFGQPSGVAYFGYEWNRLFDVQPLYFKLVGGIMYGYVDEYQDKVPFNHNGFSPVILPAVGWRLTAKDAAQVIFLGGNALMFSYNRRF